MIDVVDFYSNVLNLYFGDFKIRYRLTDENNGFDLLSKRVLLEVVDWLWRGVVSSGRCSHSLFLSIRKYCVSHGGGPINPELGRCWPLSELCYPKDC